MILVSPVIGLTFFETKFSYPLDTRCCNCYNYSSRCNKKHYRKISYTEEVIVTNSSFSIAVHALVYLNHMEKVLSSEELAQNVCTNPVLIRKVMSKLKKAGLVDTKGGNNGGYIFIADADKLTLEQVAEAIDAKFVGSPWRSGDMNKECLIASGMGEIMQNIYRQLDENCKKSLHGITVADIDRKILKHGMEPTVNEEI